MPVLAQDRPSVRRSWAKTGITMTVVLHIFIRYSAHFILHQAAAGGARENNGYQSESHPTHPRTNQNNQ
jgi:hypothetical protein